MARYRITYDMGLYFVEKREGWLPPLWISKACAETEEVAFVKLEKIMAASAQPRRVIFEVKT